MDIEPHVVRLSFTSLVLASVVMIILGIIGGFIGRQLLPPPAPLNLPNAQRLVTNVQEVTVSPSTLAANVLKNSERAVVTLTTPNGLTPVATGLIVTNDGLAVVPGPLPEGELVAYSFEGHRLTVSRLLSDNNWDLTYIRLGEGIFVPLDLSKTDPAVGSQLLAVGHSLPTEGGWTQTLQLTQYNLPPAEAAPFTQRLLVITPNNIAPAHRGSPLLNENGQLAALLVNPSQGLALPATALASSLASILEQKPAINPAETLGLELSYTFLPVNGSRRFVAVVSKLKTPSPAATAGLKTNDGIISINDQPLDWQTSVRNSLAQPFPLTVKVIRALEEHTFILTDTHESPAP